MSVELLAARPGTQHVVITGRDAPQPLLDAADLVTEMTKVKHPMDVRPQGPEGHRVVSTFGTLIRRERRAKCHDFAACRRTDTHRSRGGVER